MRSTPRITVDGIRFMRWVGGNKPVLRRQSDPSVRFFALPTDVFLCASNSLETSKVSQCKKHREGAVAPQALWETPQLLQALAGSPPRKSRVPDQAGSQQRQATTEGLLPCLGNRRGSPSVGCDSTANHHHNKSPSDELCVPGRGS